MNFVPRVAPTYIIVNNTLWNSKCNRLFIIIIITFIYK